MIIVLNYYIFESYDQVEKKNNYVEYLNNFKK